MAEQKIVRDWHGSLIALPLLVFLVAVILITSEVILPWSTFGTLRVDPNVMSFPDTNAIVGAIRAGTVQVSEGIIANGDTIITGAVSAGGDVSNGTDVVRTGDINAKSLNINAEWWIGGDLRAADTITANNLVVTTPIVYDNGSIITSVTNAGNVFAKQSIIATDTLSCGYVQLTSNSSETITLTPEPEATSSAITLIVRVQRIGRMAELVLQPGIFANSALIKPFRSTTMLPALYRPATNQVFFITVCNGGGVEGASIKGVLQITTEGKVRIGMYNTAFYSELLNFNAGSSGWYSNRVMYPTPVLP